MKILKLISTDNIISFILYTLLVLIPFTHKESFRFYDQDMIWVKYVLIISAILGLYIFTRKIYSYILDPFFILLSSILIIQYLSIIYSLDRYNSVRLVLFQTAILFSYPILKEWLINKKLDLTKYILYFTIGLSFTIVFLIVQIWLQNAYKLAIGGVWPVPEYPTRYGSVFWDVNHYAAYLVSGIFLILGFILQNRKVLSSFNFIMLISLIGLSLVAFYMTGSRSALIGGLSGLLLFISVFSIREIKFKDSRKRFVVLFLLSIVVVVLPISIIYIFANPLKEMFLYRSVSFFSHLFLLREGLRAGMDNIISGVGVNAFHAYFKNTDVSDAYYFIDPAAKNYKLPLHNLWLDYFAESGIISFILFIGLWFITLGTLLRNYLKRNDYVSLGIASGLIVFLTAGFMYSYKAEFFWVFALLGIAYAGLSVDIKYQTQINYKKYLKQVISGFGVLHAYITDGKIGMKNMIIITISLILLVSPLILIIQPMSLSEINYFYIGTSNNYLMNFYTSVLEMLRYTFGNYIFVVRLVPALVYIGLILLLVNIFNRYFHFYDTLLIVTALVLTFLLKFHIYSDGIYLISLYLYLLFLNFILLTYYYLRPGIKCSCSISNFWKRLILGYILLAGVFLTIGLKNYYEVDAYDKEISMLSELAYNRGMFDKSMVYIDSKIDPALISYFCDELLINSGYLKHEKCKLEPLANFPTDYNPALKSVLFMYKKSDSFTENNDLDYEKSDMKIISAGDYKLIFIDPKNNANNPIQEY